LVEIFEEIYYLNLLKFLFSIYHNECLLNLNLYGKIKEFRLPISLSNFFLFPLHKLFFVFLKNNLLLNFI